MARYGPGLPGFRVPPAGWREFLGDKYKPNEKDEEIIGIQNARMIWKTLTGIDNNVDDAGNSGLSKSIFDTTSHADEAHIRLINSSGSTKTITACQIRAKPVIRYSGEKARVHDNLIDYEDIIKNGEKKYEFGNNYVCTNAQLKMLVDWNWKNNRKKGHIYGVEIPGCCYWFSPGEWYTLTISDVKGAEVLDGVVVECLKVQVEAQTNQLGRSVIIFREVLIDWVHDINAVAHYVATGDPVAALNFDRLKIASSTYLMAADIYCDGASDETEINAAITFLAGAGGGIIELTEGTFVTDGATVPANNIGITGRGWNTIIEKNGAYDGITLIGSSGSEYSNVVLSNFQITKDSGDSETNDLLRFDYVDNLVLDHILADDAVQHGGHITNCDNLTVSSCSFTNAGSNGLSVLNALGVISAAKIISNLFSNNGDAGLALDNLEHSTVSGNIAKSNTDYGFAINTVNYSSICDNVAADNGDGGVLEGGFILAGEGSHNIFSGNIAEGNNKTGIYVVNADNTKNVFTGNRATGNTVANFLDNGTGTTDSGNDWT